LPEDLARRHLRLGRSCDLEGEKRPKDTALEGVERPKNTTNRQADLSMGKSFKAG
jgi:hypothetical protein